MVVVVVVAAVVEQQEEGGGIRLIFGGLVFVVFDGGMYGEAA
jgi:hypothetical protein